MREKKERPEGASSSDGGRWREAELAPIYAALGPNDAPGMLRRVPGEGAGKYGLRLAAGHSDGQRRLGGRGDPNGAVSASETCVMTCGRPADRRNVGIRAGSKLWPGRGRRAELRALSKQLTLNIQDSGAARRTRVYYGMRGGGGGRGGRRDG